MKNIESGVYKRITTAAWRWHSANEFKVQGGIRILGYSERFNHEYWN